MYTTLFLDEVSTAFPKRLVSAAVESFIASDVITCNLITAYLCSQR